MGNDNRLRGSLPPGGPESDLVRCSDCDFNSEATAGCHFGGPSRKHCGPASFSCQTWRRPGRESAGRWAALGADVKCAKRLTRAAPLANQRRQGAGSLIQPATDAAQERYMRFRGPLSCELPAPSGLRGPRPATLPRAHATGVWREGARPPPRDFKPGRYPRLSPRKTPSGCPPAPGAMQSAHCRRMRRRSNKSLRKQGLNRAPLTCAWAM